MIQLSPSLQQKFSGSDAFEQIMRLEGEVFRDHKGRRTLRFVHDGKGYFLKTHPGVGWREIFKNLLYLRWPVLGARHERDAILRLEDLGVATMKIAGYGELGSNPATLKSFLITEEIKDALSLEDLTRDWPVHPPVPAMKQALIRQVAEIARTLHTHGVNHRDFYLCHFLLERAWLDNGSNADPPLHVIDLHRTQVRRQVPQRWLIKDLAGLYFSCMDAGLTERDLYRFIKYYWQQDLRYVLDDQRALLQQVTRKARVLYAKFH